MRLHILQTPVKLFLQCMLPHPLSCFSTNFQIRSLATICKPCLAGCMAISVGAAVSVGMGIAEALRSKRCC
jgi:hypothetical protein